MAERGGLHEHKALAQRFAEHLSAKDVKSAAELVSPSFAYHAPGFPALQGRDEWQGLMNYFAANSPQLNFNVEEQVAEGNTVVTRYTWNTVHENEFMGVPPTGKKLTVTSLSLLRVENGQITEQYVLDDYLGLFRQLGAIPLAFFQEKIEVPGVGPRAVPVGEKVFA